MRTIINVARRYFCDLSFRNKNFTKKLRRYQKDLFIHQKASHINQQKMADYVLNTPKQKIAYQMANRSDYDNQLKSFIQKFNVKHKNKVTLLDFSSYITQLGDLKDKPLKKQDIELVKQFQKRKVDQRLSEIKKQLMKKSNNKVFPYMAPNTFQNQIYRLKNDQKFLQEQKTQGETKIGRFPDEVTSRTREVYQQGPFKIKDDFVIILLNVRSNTKVTTLNRINSYKTLLFMGNGNGIISYAKGSGYKPAQSLDRALQLLKKNVIAIPRDSRVTLPLAIKKRFQDYRLYLRPNPGFNAHGHPLIALMLTLAGIDHCGFHVAHTEKNVYNVLKVFFKAITTNTTPQQLAQREGFKIYRHQFIRPLTYVKTHGPVAQQAKVRQFAKYKMKKAHTFYG